MLLSFLIKQKEGNKMFTVKTSHRIFLLILFIVSGGFTLTGFYCYSALQKYCRLDIPFFAYHGHMIYCYLTLAVTAITAFILAYINRHRLRLPFLFLTASAAVVLTPLFQIIATDFSTVIAFIILAISYIYIIAATVTAFRQKTE